MSDIEKDTNREHRRLTGLTRFGLLFTAIYLIICGYALLEFGVRNFLHLKPNEMGDALAGFAAPMAFLWLILGFFQQGVELRNQIDETRKLAQEAKNQARSIATTELHARRDLFLKLVDLTYRDMSDDLARIIHNAKILGVSAATERWERFGRGDIYTFVHILSDRLIDDQHEGRVSVVESINASQSSIAAVRRYVSKWDQLIAELSKQNTGLNEYFHNSPYGRLAEFFRDTVLLRK